MAVKTFRPITPSQRYRAVSSFQEITKDKPERRLVVTKKKTGGRNSYGRMTSRTKSGGHKQKIRLVDFKRRRHGEPAKVVAIEYDPIRSARLALIQYEDGRKSYIIAPLGLKVGASVVSGPKVEAKPGNFMPLRDIPIGMTVHNIEIALGGGAKLVRSAGSGATLMSRSDGYAQLKMPSSEIRKINENCYAAVGQVGNVEHENQVFGKAGSSRHRGVKPITRGVVKNPVDHPMGGGEGRTSGGGPPVTPWGVETKGHKTRKKKKYSDAQILVRRDGRQMKQR